jgi:Ca-activated chloride channel family protein
VLKPFQSFLFLLTLTVFSFAQTAPTATPTPKKNDTVDDDEVIKINSRLVVVPVSVTDAQGQPVSGLKIADFRLLEENKAQTIEQIGAAEEVPLEIAVLIDISASTDPMFKFEQETAAQFLRGIMKERDRATLITISNNPKLELSRATAENAAAGILSLMPAKQSTAFYDTVTFAADYLKKNAPADTRKVVIVISDGEDNNSVLIRDAVKSSNKTQSKEIDTLTPERRLEIFSGTDAAHARAVTKVLRDLQNADTVLYSVNPAGSSYHLNKISKRGQEGMQKFADQTGGTAFVPRNADDLTAIFRRISAELRAQYLLQYYTDTDLPVGSYVNLQVSLPNGTQYRVRARRGYFVKN